MAQQADTHAADKNGHTYFHLRRIQSLLGLVPIGVFVCFHLTINATILLGPDKFQASVEQLHVLSNMGLLVLVETAFIFVPMLFHAVLGVVILLNGSVNVAAHRYGSNVRYVLQRVTGAIAFAFVLVHLWQMHWLGGLLGGGAFVVHDPEIAFSAAVTTSEALRSASVMWGVIYVIGVCSIVYHLANGIWTALITWGVTIGPRSQRVSGYACTAFGLCLAMVGLGALCGFYNYEPSEHGPSEHGPQEIVASAAGLG